MDIYELPIELVNKTLNNLEIEHEGIKANLKVLKHHLVSWRAAGYNEEKELFTETLISLSNGQDYIVLMDIAEFEEYVLTPKF